MVTVRSSARAMARLGLAPLRPRASASGQRCERAPLGRAGPGRVALPEYIHVHPCSL